MYDKPYRIFKGKTYLINIVNVIPDQFPFAKRAHHQMANHVVVFAAYREHSATASRSSFGRELQQFADLSLHLDEPFATD